MKDIYKSFVVREAEMLSHDQIEKSVIFSHPPNQNSPAYQDWIKYCERDSSIELNNEIYDFLEHKALTSLDSFHPILKELVSIQVSKNFIYSAKDILAKKFAINFKEVTSTSEKNSRSILNTTISNLSDQLLAESLLIEKDIPRDFDIQGVIKSLYCLKMISREEENPILDLLIDKFHDQPIVLNSCLLESHCKERVSSPFNNIEGKSACKCQCNQECLDPSKCCAQITPFVADLYIVKSEIDCYEPSEISHIENVIQSEIRKKKHRYLQREEFENEETTETTSFNEKTHQSDERFSIEKEINKNIQQDIGADAGLTVNGKWGNSTFVATANLSFNQSKSTAQRTAINESKEVVKKAISRIETKVTSKAIHRLLYETEEKNTHVFGGTDGAANDMSRQFYYVNQVNKGQVFNYGKRLMLDFYVPEPSELYKRPRIQLTNAT